MFTPGPWKVREVCGKPSNEIVGSESVHTNGLPRNSLISSASYSDVVCEVHGWMELDAPKANARLIAAAPDLLSLLIELTDIEGPQPGHIAWANKVKAAIKKATESV